MKKIVSGFIVFVIVAGLSLLVYAQSNTIVKLIVGNKEATVNGKTVILDVPPKVENGRTLVPLRFIGEALGAKVDYEASTRTITMTLKDINSLETEVADLNKQIESMKTEYTAKVADLEKEVAAKTATITEKENRIKKLEDQVTQKETEITSLNNKVAELEKQITQLQEDLKKAGGTSRETNLPLIKINNITDGQVISEAIKIDAKIDDESGIVFVRVKMGTQILSEDPANLGEIKPEKYVSGKYNLTIEAYDAYANKGTIALTIEIKNTAKLEPVSLKAIPVDQSLGMIGGSGDPEKTMALLTFQFTNKALSNIEVLKVECYDKQGKLDELMPGVSFYDMMKTSLIGMEHLWVHSKDKVGPFMVSVDATQSGKKAAEYYDGWKMKISFYDSIMDKEFFLEASVSAK